MATSSDYEFRTLLQADRLLTQTCENKKVLLDDEYDILPYTFKTMIQKSAQDREIASAHLSGQLTNSPTYRSAKYKQTPAFKAQESFNAASDRLCKSSSKLNKSLTTELANIQ